MRRAEHFVVHWRQHRLREKIAQTAIGFNRSLVRRRHKQNRHGDRTAPRFLDEADLMRHRKKDSNDSWPRSMTLVVSSSAIRRSNSAIWPLMSRTVAIVVF